MARGNDELYPQQNRTLENRTSENSNGQIAQDLVFGTLDGFITVGAMSDKEWESMCEVLQKPVGIGLRFKNTSARLKNAKIRLQLTSEILR